MPKPSLRNEAPNSPRKSPLSKKIVPTTESFAVIDLKSESNEVDAIINNLQRILERNDLCDSKSAEGGQCDFDEFTEK